MSQRSIKTYLYEGVVIVASILVAFFLDASWASYQEGKVEGRVLGELHDELESAKDRIEFSITELQSALGSTYELLEFVGADPKKLSAHEAQGFFNSIFALNTLEVPSSVLDSIIASGQVRLVSSAELRAALSNYPSLIADVRENHEWHRAETDEFLIPYFAQYISIRDANLADGSSTHSPGTFKFDAATMQTDPAFEGRLVWRAMRQEATLSESELLLAETENLLALINIEIN